ncbi:alpha-hydroxy-acid oxidizing protein [Nocardia sp. NPDC049149]|uniref:alpha-hydroxy-acid oxidizing protein n=1 Tax=Nocardia sp. NPDC049149 TaxID=3364315 RepID=UPI0037178D23
MSSSFADFQHEIYQVIAVKTVLYEGPLAYRLGIAGDAGVRHAARLLLADFGTAMSLAGCANLTAVPRSLVATAR